MTEVTISSQAMSGVSVSSQAMSVVSISSQAMSGVSVSSSVSMDETIIGQWKNYGHNWEDIERQWNGQFSGVAAPSVP
jgi:hypothetical protein